MTSEQWCVVCAEYAWESGPLPRADAEELLDAEFPVHPFAGACASAHYLTKYEGE